MKPYQQRKNKLMVVFFGEVVLWYHLPDEQRSKKNYMKDILESPAWRAQREVLCGGLKWTKNLKKLLTSVTHVNIPGISQQQHPLQPWEWPQRPWVHVHADYAGPFLAHMFLILFDAHSKWMEVKCVASATSSITIEHIWATFSTHGLPEMLVTDNGSVFISSELMQRNGIRQAPHHPASNGLTERSVQTFREHMLRTTKGTAFLVFCFNITIHHTLQQGYHQQNWCFDEDRECS